MLLGCYRSGDASDPDVYVRAVAALLASYPSEVMKAVCDPRWGLATKSKWLPTLSEVKEACEDAMEPIARRIREEKAAEERRLALAKPAFVRPTMAELKAKYGENWGLKGEDEGKAYIPRALDELCKQAGISQNDFEAINDKAAKHQREFLANHPEWRK